MQNLKDGWYVKREYKDENGNYHTETSDYMSKVEAQKICDSYNAKTNTSIGSAYLMYDKDFDTEEE